MSKVIISLGITLASPLIIFYYYLIHILLNTLFNPQDTHGSLSFLAFCLTIATVAAIALFCACYEPPEPDEIDFKSKL